MVGISLSRLHFISVLMVFTNYFIVKIIFKLNFLFSYFGLGIGELEPFTGDCCQTVWRQFSASSFLKKIKLKTTPQSYILKMNFENLLVSDKNMNIERFPQFRGSHFARDLIFILHIWYVSFILAKYFSIMILIQLMLVSRPLTVTLRLDAGEILHVMYFQFPRTFPRQWGECLTF